MIDKYGRKIPKHAHGTVNLDHMTSSTKIIMEAVMKLYERIMNDKLLVRRINITANNIISENSQNVKKSFEQIDLFTDYEKKKEDDKQEKREHEMQKAIIDIKKKYGKNAIIKGMNLEERRNNNRKK